MKLEPDVLRALSLRQQRCVAPWHHGLPADTETVHARLVLHDGTALPTLELRITDVALAR